MQLIKARNYEDLSRKAANLIAAQITLKPSSILGLATGSTPLGMYGRLAELFRQGDLDFSRVTTVNLDEYCGIPSENPQSYRSYMNRYLFSQVNIDLTRTHLPDGMLADEEQACVEYDAVLSRLGGIDLQLLGLGRNGHIGFNEPADDFPKGTHSVRLSESTLAANRRFFSCAEEMPTKALTMGIGSIFQANHILLLVSGGDKADILARALYGPVTPQIPASILQFHPRVTVIADLEALGL